MQEPEKSGRCEPKLTLPSLRAVNFVEFLFDGVCELGQDSKVNTKADDGQLNEFNRAGGC